MTKLECLAVKIYQKPILAISIILAGIIGLGLFVGIVTGVAMSISN